MCQSYTKGFFYYDLAKTANFDYGALEEPEIQPALHAFTIGSYFLAERLHKRQRAPNAPRPVTLRASPRRLTDEF